MGNVVSSIFGGGQSAPAVPDYASAANATAAGNLENAKLAQVANMVNQYTPQGKVEYKPIGTVDGFTQWGQTVSMSPEQQKLYDQSNRINQGLGDVSEQGLGYVQSALDKPLSFEGMQALQTPGQIQQAASDAAYQNATRYLDPQYERQGARLENQLANQGITRGSEAWNNAMAEQNAAKDMAYSGARNQAYSQGLTGAGQAYNQGLGTRQQQINEAQTLQQNPINMLNAVRSGQQMSAGAQPQVNTSAPGQMATVAGPDLLGAQSAQYNAQLGAYNAQNAQSAQGLAGLSNMGTAAAAMKTAGMFSDRRMKENIIKVGKLDSGLDLYKFEYKPEFKDEAGHGSFIGVMADEAESVFPDSVSVAANGFKQVNYGVIYA